MVGMAVLAAAIVLAYTAAGSAHRLIYTLGCTACLVVAATLLRAVSAQVITLDRRAGVIRVRTQHIFGTASVIHRLRDVADVILERRPMDDGRDLFRAAFVMRNGTHQAWGTGTVNYAGADQVTVVRAMREFLGTAGTLTAPDGSVAIPRPPTDPMGWAKRGWVTPG
jgi:hypothetical protein